MPFSKETFAPKNYQNLLSFGQNFNKIPNSALEIRQILEKEVLPLVKKWNNYKLSPDYRKQIILSGSFLILNCLVSVFYLMMIFSLIYLMWFIFNDNFFAEVYKSPSTYYFITFILILIFLFPRLPSNRAIWRYFKVHKDLFFYNFGDNFKAEIINKCLFDYPNLAFYPNGDFITRQNIKESGLFGNFRHFHFEDQISEIQETKLNFKMAEIDLETYGKVFTGLFFVANFSAQSQTYILPKGFRFESRLEKVILESPVFMNFFEVFASSQTTSRLILQTDIMDKLNNFTTNHSQKIHLSCQKNQIFVAIEFPKNLFEAQTFSKEKISNLVAFVEILDTVTELITALKLE